VSTAGAGRGGCGLAGLTGLGIPRLATPIRVPGEIPGVKRTGPRRLRGVKASLLKNGGQGQRGLAGQQRRAGRVRKRRRRRTTQFSMSVATPSLPHPAPN